jgi:hypothetical protein
MAHRFLGALRKRGVDVSWRDLRSYRATVDRYCQVPFPKMPWSSRL